MVALKVEKMGETLGVVLSEDARQLLDAKAGDVLYLDAGSNGDLVLTKQAPSLKTGASMVGRS